MVERTLNWAGHSIETIAAMYETDKAAQEAEEGLINLQYVWSAAEAEGYERSVDDSV